MKRTQWQNLQVNGMSEIQTLKAFATRHALAKIVSQQSFNGARDIYAQLGYPLSLEYNDFMGRYQRQDMAKAVIDRPAKKTWSGAIQVLESDDGEQTAFEKAWEDLYTDFGLNSIFFRADKLTGIGRYGVIMLGLNDVKNISDYTQPATRNAKLLYVKPFGERTVVIQAYESDPSSERFGKPLYYEITLNDEDTNNGTTIQLQTIRVHHTRVVHIVDDILESEIHGMPRLESVFNRLMDLEKLVGGDAEMFWKGARPGYTGKVDKDFKTESDFKDTLFDQIEEYEHGLSRFLIHEGMELKELTQQVSDPSSHVDVQIQMISAVTGIPKRILTGSERGELASSQDKDEMNAYIKDRRTDFSEPRVIRPFIKALQAINILPTVLKYTIVWEDLFAISDKDKADIGETRAKTLKAYADSGMAQDLIPPEAFLQYIMNLPPEVVEVILQMRDQAIRDEVPLTAEEQEIIDAEENENDED